MIESQEYQIPPAAPRRSGAFYIAWAVVIAVVSVALLLSTRNQKKPSASGGIQLEMACRYVVGAKSFLGNDPDFKTKLTGMWVQAQSAAVGWTDHLRIIPVDAEVQGNLAARDALDHFLNKCPDEELRSDARILSAIYAERMRTISPEQSDRIISRHGWFGRLAVSKVGGSSGVLYRKVIADAKRTFITLMGGLVLILILCLTGLVLLIFFIVRWAMGKLPPRFAEQRTAPRSADIFIESFAIYLLFMILISLPHLAITRLGGLKWEGLLIVPILAAIGWARLRGIAWRQMQRDLGWTRGRGIAREIASGVVGYIAGLPVIAIGLMLATFLGKISGQHTTHPIVHYIQDAGPNRIILFLLACVFAPLAEETMFRGFLFGHMRLRHGWLVSTIVVSAIFAAIHPQGWPAIPVLASIAIVLAGLREQRGSLIASMAAHAINNFALLVMLILAVG